MEILRHGGLAGQFPAAVAFLAALTGVAIATLTGHTIYRNRVARHWPQVDGRVVSTRTFLQDESLGRPGSHYEARADVRFTYRVNGRQYESSNLSYARGIGGTPPYVYPAQYAVRYPAGAAVAVSYNPLDPAEAVVDASHDPLVLAAVGIALVAMFVAYQLWLRTGGTPAAT